MYDHLADTASLVGEPDQTATFDIFSHRWGTKSSEKSYGLIGDYYEDEAHLNQGTNVTQANI
jgi:hypothetical protein